MASSIHRPSPLGTTIFCGLRSANILLRYGNLVKYLAAPALEALGVSPVSSHSSLNIAFGLHL